MSSGHHPIQLSSEEVPLYGINDLLSPVNTNGCFRVDVVITPSTGIRRYLQQNQSELRFDRGVAIHGRLRHPLSAPEPPASAAPSAYITGASSLPIGNTHLFTGVSLTRKFRTNRTNRLVSTPVASVARCN